jgi:hypothetical protein
MWPFTKTEKTETPDPIYEIIKGLKSFRKVGETFDYLGVTMMVTDHSQLIHERIGLGINPYKPGLVCDYVDKEGILRNCVFSPREVKALIRNAESSPIAEIDVTTLSSTAEND